MAEELARDDTPGAAVEGAAAMEAAELAEGARATTRAPFAPLFLVIVPIVDFM